jgi:hypothetical protein
MRLVVKDEKHGDLLLFGASDIEDNTNLFSVNSRVSEPKGYVVCSKVVSVDVCRHLR